MCFGVGQDYANKVRQTAERQARQAQPQQESTGAIERRLNAISEDNSKPGNPNYEVYGVTSQRQDAAIKQADVIANLLLKSNIKGSPVVADALIQLASVGQQATGDERDVYEPAYVRPEIVSLLNALGNL